MYTFHMMREFKTELVSGALIAGATAVWIAGEYVLASLLQRPELGSITGIIAIIIPILGLWFGIHRKKSHAKSFPYSRAVGTGMLISLIAAVLNATFIFVFLSALPNVNDGYFASMEQSLASQGYDAEQIALQLSVLKNIYSPQNQALQMFLGTIVGGAILTLIIALFIRTRPIKRTPIVRTSPNV